MAYAQDLQRERYVLSAGCTRAWDYLYASRASEPSLPFLR